MNHNQATRTRMILLMLAIACVSVLAVMAVSRCESATPSCEPADVSSDEMLYVVTPDGQPSKLLYYKGMNISFNPELKIPNWVAWELTGDETTGSEPRYDRFAADPRVHGCPDPADYKLSGYDRGHMAPAGDMKWDPEAMAQTFYMTNICPQAHRLNAGPWKTLEEKCRLWARVDSAIYIVCGPVPTDAPIERIGANRVAVPQRFFKVVVSPYSNPPRGIGFIMNNGENRGGLQPTAMSIDRVEAITGYDFFASLPDSLENMIESQNQFHTWPTRER